MESPSTQARAKGTVMKTVRAMLPATFVWSLGQRRWATGAAHRPAARAKREAQRAPSAATV
ncbi:hypothetical protein SVIOM74S_07147 [Streptomyces violarus]